MNLGGDLLVAQKRRERRQRPAIARTLSAPQPDLLRAAVPYRPSGATARVVVIGPDHLTYDPAIRKMVRRLPGYEYELPTEQALSLAASGVVHLLDAVRPDWWGAPGRVLTAEPLGAVELGSMNAGPGALRIAQGCSYDPGSAVYRFHSAVNETTKHASALVRWYDSNQHCSLRQYDGDRDAPTVRQMVLEADVLHCHVDYILTQNALGRPTRPREGQLLIRHYHGSRREPRQTNYQHDLDREIGALRVGARLTLCAERGAEDVQWLPIAVPVARYAALRAWQDGARTDRRTFRIAHSPTVRSYKGSDAFMSACADLRARGLPIEPVLIEGLWHGEALRVKASCDAVFDSFWLGIQGSGLEGGAMGMPVIAGDVDVKALYEQHVGHMPYTFADDQATLAAAIERLATDRAFYDAEAERVAAYVRQYHDYAAVTARYETMIGKALGRPDVATTPIKRRRAAGAR